MCPLKPKLVIYNENTFLSLTWAPASFDSCLDDGVGRGWGDEADLCSSSSHNRKVNYNIRNHFSYLPRGLPTCHSFEQVTAASLAIVIQKEKLENLWWWAEECGGPMGGQLVKTED